MTAKCVMDLASPVFLFVASFLRKAERGISPSYEDARREITSLLRKLEELSLASPDLVDLWAKAKRPLVYLIDETMVVNARWEQPSKTRWENENLETEYLGEDQTLRGVRFFEECDEELRTFKTAERLARQDRAAQAELLEVYCICLKLGFKGRLVTSPSDLAEYTASIFTKLPAHPATVGNKLFPETEEHTAKDKPVYTTMLRLSTVIAVFVGLLLTYVLVTRTTWNDLTGDVSGVSEKIVAPPSQEPTNPND